jgi:hypothetical protein
MKNYLAVFIGTNTSPRVVEFMAMEEGKRKKLEASGMKAWGEWMAAHHSDIMASGGPLGKTKRTSAQGVADVKNNMSGFVIVKAASHEAAAKMFEKHPQFMIFPGDGVEVMEVLPIPGQPQAT